MQGCQNLNVGVKDLQLCGNADVLRNPYVFKHGKCSPCLANSQLDVRVCVTKSVYHTPKVNEELNFFDGLIIN